MEIVTTTSITLSNEEKEALQTLKEAYNQCICIDSFSCEDCPLYLDSQCLGVLCARVIERSKNEQNY